MTRVIYLDGTHLRAPPQSRISQRDKLPSPLARLIAAWNRQKTERILEGLPQEIRKDIGWPTTNIR